MQGIQLCAKGSPVLDTEEVWQPPPLMNNLMSMHNGVKAEVSADSATTPEIEVTNGIHVCQACTIAPTLFNLYFNFVIQQWHKMCQPFDLEILYKRGRKLVVLA